MLQILTIKSHPVPAIYAGTEYLRDVGDDLDWDARVVDAANRIIADMKSREQKPCR